jgi:predicted phage terminase large subunit-like protein
LYQQHPVPRDGGLFKSEWIKYGNPPSGGKFVRYWDRASTASADACNTAGVLIQRLGHEFYIRDIVVGRWDVKRRDQNILATAKMDVDLNPRIFVEQEPSSAGVESVQNAMNMLQGYPAYPDRVRGDKVVRADPLASAFGMGKVTICPAPWNDSFVTELLGFPNGRFCDQVDAAAGAFSKLTRDTDPQAAADILRSL